MRSQEWALLRQEIKRRLVSPKYAIVLLVFGYFAWRTTAQAQTYGSMTGLPYNAWDVFLGLFGGTATAIPVAMVFPMLFVFLLGGSVQQDVLSGYSMVVQSRMDDRNSYWWVKIVAIMAVIAITVVVIYVVSLGFGIAGGLSPLPAVLSQAGGHPDAWTRAVGAPPIYYSLPRGTNVFLHGLLVIAYMAFAYFAVVVFVVGLTVRSRNGYASLALGLLLSASGLAMSYAASDVAFSFSLTAALTESSHRPIPAADFPTMYAVPWSHSLLLLGGMALIGVVVGAALTPTRAPRVRGRQGRAGGSLPGNAVVRAVTVLMLLPTITGCVPRDFAMPSNPQVPEVELGRLSPADQAYLQQVASSTVELGDAVSALNYLWDPKYLHADDEVIGVLLEERLDSIASAIAESRELTRPTAFDEWYRLQYGPALDELQCAIDGMSPALAANDQVGIRMCFRHFEYANVYLMSAGQSISASTQ